LGTHHLREKAKGLTSSQLSAKPKSNVKFLAPLLEAGYPPAVAEFKTNRLRDKPLLVYLPGFDGSLLAPFLQFPELGTEFDVKGMTIKMDDRSSLDDLKDLVIRFIDEETKLSDDDGESNELQLGDDKNSNKKKEGVFSFLPNMATRKKSQSKRTVFLMGESFGGILALETSLLIQKLNKERSPSQRINLQHITLINPATCYNESNLAKEGPPLTKISPFLYPFQLMTLLPLFTDDYALPQLILSLQSKALPSIIDNPQRESYMGRTAFSLPTTLEFMPQKTLKWRLEEWLTKGSTALSQREQEIRKLDVPVLIVAGEFDKTLPSVAEASRLSRLFRKSFVHIVDGAGHACTSGSRVDLAALIRGSCPDYNFPSSGRTEMKEEARKNSGIYYGMEKRYDNASLGMMPTLYWSKENYQSI